MIRFAIAGLAPENVAVVVNGQSWASLTVANEYVRLRGIPPCNVIVLKGLSNIETTDVDHFRKEILAPVFAAINSRGLAKQIDCIAYSVDIPYAVDVTGDMAGMKFPLVITGMASTNGLTYLHEWVERKDTEYLRLDINRYNRRTLPLPRGASLTPIETADMAHGLDLYEQKKYAESAEVLKKLLAVPRSDADIAYDLACSYSLAGKLNEAMAALQTAVDTGWRNAVQTSSDPDLKPLAGRADFQNLLQKMRAMPLKVQEGFGFRSSISWGHDGTPAASGPHYMLSTMLGVTCGRGNSVGEVLASLRRSAGADGTSPTGTIYFPENGDVRSTTRAWAFHGAADALRQIGINAVVESGVLPVNRQDVAGAMIGTAGFDWGGSKSSILPGAIVEHFTSFGGIITERSDQTPCTEFIRAGAAGSSGTVTEPYALQQKFPTAFIQVLYCRGWTLAESYYQSLFGPYQLLIIGDPLCKPWSKPIRVSMPPLTDGQVVKGALEIRPKVAPADAQSVSGFDLYIDGRYSASASPGTPLRFDTSQTADGAHSVAVVCIQKGPQRACSRASVTVQVNNRSQALTTQPEPKGPHKWGDVVSVKASCRGASSIELLQFGNPVALIQSGHDVLQVSTTTLGIGTATLQPVAHTTSGAVYGSPVRIQVAPPDGLVPVTLDASEKLAPGLEIAIDGAAGSVVKDTLDPGWLSALVKTSGRHFTLSGLIEVTKADLYQVQVKTNTGASVQIDGSSLLRAADDRQQFAPVALLPGLHRLKVLGIAPQGATMDIRFGAAGILHLAEAQWKHVVK